MVGGLGVKAACASLSEIVLARNPSGANSLY